LIVPPSIPWDPASSESDSALHHKAHRIESQPRFVDRRSDPPELFLRERYFLGAHMVVDFFQINEALHIGCQN
jgi:hypothetical protein